MKTKDLLTPITAIVCYLVAACQAFFPLDQKIEAGSGVVMVLSTNVVTNLVIRLDSIAITNSAALAAKYVAAMRSQGVAEEVAALLAASGDVCKRVKHSWRPGRPGEGEGSPMGSWYLDYHPGVTYRTCRICGTCESGTEIWSSYMAEQPTFNLTNIGHLMTNHSGW